MDLDLKREIQQDYLIYSTYPKLRQNSIYKKYQAIKHNITIITEL